MSGRVGVGVPVLFGLLLDIATKRGVSRINERPRGVWEDELPDGWRVCVNASKVPVRSLSGMEVPPFTAFLEKPEMFACSALISPADGVVIGTTEEAIEAVLRKALA